jgi:hypothetical protein
MNTEFKNLYVAWYNATCILSTGLHECKEWKDLVAWSKEHKEESVDGIIELLTVEPNWIVKLCDELFPDALRYEGWMSLNMVCNTWLTILKSYKDGTIDKIDFTRCPNNYEDYEAYQEYLKDHYIPWNPFREDDPNITLIEFNEGKRNDEELLRKKLKECQI